jgi:SAM-dependent methyltransferase
MTKWESFFKEKCIEIFTSSKEVIDIGGSLRIDGTRSSRVSDANSWVIPYVQKVEYKILDPVPDYNPDILGDIHDLPFEDNSKEAILCLAVLEHVQNPFKAMQELHRVLRPGGRLLIYVPFLYYYHAHDGYYKDYWRYTYDGLEELAKPFTRCELQNVRDRFETLCRLTTFGRHSFFIKLVQFFDKIFPKENSRQVAGYYMFLVK